MKKKITVKKNTIKDLIWGEVKITGERENANIFISASYEYLNKKGGFTNENAKKVFTQIADKIIKEGVKSKTYYKAKAITKDGEKASLDFLKEMSKTF
jgi:hypothetical protein